MEGISLQLRDSISLSGTPRPGRSCRSESSVAPHYCFRPDDRYTNPEGAITGLAFSPTSNLLAFTSFDGSFSRWKEPIPSNLPSPVTSEAVAAKELDKLLDDEFEDDVDMEEKGEDIGDDLADDWIVDDDGVYGADDDERKFSKGRTEVG